uniref:Uncharacterized protein n=1 Tax=Rhizophora mucronata TaxID=61149 RepID=A0A2P2MSI9_RHIMU
MRELARMTSQNRSTQLQSHCR